MPFGTWSGRPCTGRRRRQAMSRRASPSGRSTRMAARDRHRSVQTARGRRAGRRSGRERGCTCPCATARWAPSRSRSSRASRAWAGWRVEARSESLAPTAWASASAGPARRSTPAPSRPTARPSRPGTWSTARPSGRGGGCGSASRRTASLSASPSTLRTSLAPTRACGARSAAKDSKSASPRRSACRWRRLPAWRSSWSTTRLGWPWCGRTSAKSRRAACSCGRARR
mmetsp:Transcript_44179/g.127807  ORF Transcript_44179/g.127807 Transcript_44179/m.127807 type:complete len:228 (+) Transcript_44179:1649-2332(+)